MFPESTRPPTPAASVLYTPYLVPRRHPYADWWASYNKVPAQRSQFCVLRGSNLCIARVDIQRNPCCRGSRQRFGQRSLELCWLATAPVESELKVGHTDPG